MAESSNNSAGSDDSAISTSSASSATEDASVTQGFGPTQPPAEPSSEKNSTEEHSGAAQQPAEPSSEEIATEGVFIAAATTRLTIKNRILVDTLSGNIDFSVDKYVDFARETLRDLARESESEVVRIEEMIQRAKRRRGRSRAMSMHDYQKADLGNLKHRRDQADLVAHKLRERAADDEAVEGLVRAAHKAAWNEISRNIQFNLASEFATVGELTEDERLDRENRLRDVMRVDLPQLSRDLRILRKRKATAARQSEGTGDSSKTGDAGTSPRGFFGRLWERVRARG